MKLEHSFTVPVGIDQAWQTLLDVETIAPCMPGAALDSVDGDSFTGTVKVKLGPVGLTYKGKASFIEKDVANHRAVIDAQGRDARGNGTAKALVTATLTAQGESTQVVVSTDLNITGKPAQFGRGVMVDVGNKLIGQFADCLSGKLTAGADVSPEPAAAPPPATDSGPRPTRPVAVADPPRGAASASFPAESAVSPPAGSADSTAAARPQHRAPAPEVEPIDLLGSAGPAVLKRLAPVAGAIAVLVALLVWFRRR